MIWFNMPPDLTGSIIQSDREKKWQRFVRGKRWFEQTIFHCNFWSLLEFHHVSELACLPSLLQNIENFQHTLFGRISLQYWIRAHGQWADRLIRSRARSKVFPLICPQFPPKSMIPTKVHDYRQSQRFPPDQIVFVFHTRRETARRMGKVFTKKFLWQNLPQKSKKISFGSNIAEVSSFPLWLLAELQKLKFESNFPTLSDPLLPFCQGFKNTFSLGEKIINILFITGPTFLLSEL